MLRVNRGELSNDGEHTENNEQGQECKLPLEQFHVGFRMVFLNNLIISAESIA